MSNILERIEIIQKHIARFGSCKPGKFVYMSRRIKIPSPDGNSSKIPAREVIVSYRDKSATFWDPSEIQMARLYNNSVELMSYTHFDHGKIIEIGAVPVTKIPCDDSLEFRFLSGDEMIGELRKILRPAKKVLWCEPPEGESMEKEDALDEIARFFDIQKEDPIPYPD